MGIVINRVDQRHAVQLIHIYPADYVLRDREGAEVDEQDMLATTEANLVRGQQWAFDTLGVTFDLAPTLIFRSTKTEAQMRAETPNYHAALIRGMFDANAAGLLDHLNPYRLYHCLLPLAWMEYGGNAQGGGGLQNPRYMPGFVVAAGPGNTLGGVKRPYRCVPTTVAVGPNPTNVGTSLTVAAGHGTRFSVVPHEHFKTITVVTGAPTTATSITLHQEYADLTVGMEAVLYAPHAEPSPANAEAVVITSRSADMRTFGIQRARLSTSAKSIAVGWRIGIRNKAARIWRNGGQPEDGDAESVRVTNVVGDTLTIVRAQNDALNLGAGTTARPVQVGDRIAMVDDAYLSFAQNANQAIGGFVHETGHCLGFKFWTPRESAAFDTVVWNGTSNVIEQRDATIQYPYPGDIAAGHQNTGYYQHLPHTQNNPNTVPPGAWQDTGQSRQSIMIAWYNWPDLDWTADEAARITANRFGFMNVTSRPPDWTADGKGHLGGPHASGSTGAGGGGGENAYKVQPLAWWASDTAADTAIWQDSGDGLPVPFDPAVFLSNVNANVLEVRRWFWDQFDQYTFDALPAIMYVSPDTKATLLTTMPGVAHFHQGMFAADQANVDIDFTDATRLHYMVTPLANMAGQFGIAHGRAENFTSFVPPYTAQGELPCACIQWGHSSGRSTGRDLGGMLSTTGTASQRSLALLAQGTFAHELGHVFGYSPSWPNPDHLYPHDSSVPLAGGQNLMHADMAQLSSLRPSADAVDRFKASSFLRHYPTRP